MDIKSKECELFYRACVIFSELQKIESQILSAGCKSNYFSKLKNILELKDKWVESATSFMWE